MITTLILEEGSLESILIFKLVGIFLTLVFFTQIRIRSSVYSLNITPILLKSYFKFLKLHRFEFNSYPSMESMGGRFDLQI